MPRFTIVIRCYNEEEHIGKLLSGIMQQTLTDFEIIIVDSGSTDATLTIAARYPIKLLHITPDEFSFGRSLNRGCAIAQGEILVFASAHVYPVYDDWLGKLVQPFEDSRVALSYGCQRGNHITRYSEHQVFAKWFPDRGSFDQQHPFCNNANAAIRRTLWEEYRYDETLTGLEDIEWARRVVSAGHKIAYVSDALVTHVHRETPRRIFNRYHREAIALKRIFPAERFTLGDFVYLFSTNVLSDLYHAARDRELAGNISSILAFRLMQFWGTFRGYKFRGPVNSKLRQTFYYPRGLARPQATPEEAHERRLIDYSTG